MTGPVVDVIICDLDGTMVDTLPGIAHSVSAVLESCGLPPVTIEFVRENIGGGATNLIAKVLGDEQADRLDEVVQAFSAHYNANADWGATLYSGVKETLTSLAGWAKLAVATAKSRPGTDRVLSALGIDGFFDPVITMSEMVRPKPDPGSIQTILERWGIPPQRALIVGDTMTDVRTAQNAGCHIWAVSYGYGYAGLLREGGYDRLIDSFDQLQQLGPANGGQAQERKAHE